MFYDEYDMIFIDVVDLDGLALWWEWKAVTMQRKCFVLKR
jgi:hypothetical protein